MTDSEMMEILYITFGNANFTVFRIRQHLSSEQAEHASELLQRLSKSKAILDGFRAKNIADGVFKLIPIEKNAHISPESDSKPKPLPKATSHYLPPKAQGDVSDSDAAVMPFAKVPDELKQSRISKENVTPLPGLVSTSVPPLTHPKQKRQASNQLTAWRYAEHTPLEWIGLLDRGRTIATGQFVAADDGKYYHRKGLWKGTRFICCDGDVIRGVDYDKHGIDEHPEGVEPFTDPQRLIELYPALEDEAFALGHSLSSLWAGKPPPHVRARISFLTEIQITLENYNDFLIGLSIIYPIISASRQPAQPVFGNASRRREFKDSVVVELDAPFRSRIYGNVLSAVRVQEIIALGREHGPTKERKPSRPIGKAKLPAGDLVTWLADRGISILGTRHNAPCANGTATMYLVTCPWESDHTEAFGAKDTAVFEDPSNGHWCFNCFHAHCYGRGWEDFRAKVAPRDTISPEAYQSSRKPYSKTRARLNRTRTFYR